MTKSFRDLLKALRSGDANRTDEVSLVSVVRRLTYITTMLEKIMATVAEIKSKLDALQVDVEGESTVLGSVKTLLGGLVATVSSLKEQLAAAIAAGGNDPVALQAVADGLDALASKVTADTADIAAAVTVNTPSGAAKA